MGEFKCAYCKKDIPDSNYWFCATIFGKTREEDYNAHYCNELCQERHLSQRLHQQLEIGRELYSKMKQEFEETNSNLQQQLNKAQRRIKINALRANVQTKCAQTAEDERNQLQQQLAVKDAELQHVKNGYTCKMCKSELQQQLAETQGERTYWIERAQEAEGQLAEQQVKTKAANAAKEEVFKWLGHSESARKQVEAERDQLKQQLQAERKEHLEALEDMDDRLHEAEAKIQKWESLFGKVSDMLEFQQYEARLAEQQSENQSLKKQLSTWEETSRLDAENINRAWSEYHKLEAKSAVMRGALQFYADKNIYRAYENYNVGGYNDPQIYFDEGEKACKALADDAGQFLEQYNRMKNALENIIDPMAYLFRKAEEQGRVVTEYSAHYFCNDIETYKWFAREALPDRENK
jgi:chromosome segregation ATPase